MNAASIVEKALTRLLPTIEDDLKQVTAAPAGSPPLFYRMIHYHMGWCDAEGRPADERTGKRIRPLLALLVAEAVSGEHNPARPSAAAVELVHNFSLLHDDIQDQSPTRRGRPTVWCVWGQAQAINAGDVLFALSQLAIPRLSRYQADPQKMVASLEILGETSLELTRGQHLDMLFETQAHITPAEYMDMINGKTAALVAHAAQLGALNAGATAEQREHYRAFGENLGMAFQVCDDMLDIWGDPDKTGKAAAIDIYQRKKSLPVIFGLAQSEEMARLYAREEPFDEAAVQRIMTLLEDSGAHEQAEATAERYSQATLAHLHAASPQGEAGETLEALVEILLKRTG